MTTVCIFEDDAVSGLYPLTYLHPVYDLRCGVFSLAEKIVAAFPGSRLVLHCRPELAEQVREDHPDTPVNQLPSGRLLFINGAVLTDAHMRQVLDPEGPDTLFMNGPVLIAARVDASQLGASSPVPAAITASLFPGVPVTPVPISAVRYPWELVNANGAQLCADFKHIALNTPRPHAGTIYPGSHLLAPSDIIIGEGAVVKPGAVLDAEQGPIIIGTGAVVYPNAVIEGPAFIGARSRIKIGAKIYENTSIGEMCKVGGEVEGSIIHSHANKQHDGFLGHAYLGMWVNLGADTNNSDLKNNYSTVRVTINGREIDSGSQFVGLIMGDHSKSGINTMFNTGTVAGVSSNIFGPGFPAKYIPSFAWGGAEGWEEYEIGRALDVARKVMARRKVTLTATAEQLLVSVFKETRQERAAFIIRTIE